MKSLSILVPAYNEEAYIEKLLLELVDLDLSLYVASFDICVIDDASTDSTTEIARKIAKKTDTIRVIRQKKNQGKGAAIRTGIAHTQGEFIIIQDADNELSPQDIPSLLKKQAKTNAEFISGSRFLSQAITIGGMRTLSNKVFSWITSLLIGGKISDMACGYKLFSRKLLEKFTLAEDRFGFEAELVMKAVKKAKTKIIEVPVSYHPRTEAQGKKIRKIDGVKILWTLLKNSI